MCLCSTYPTIATCYTHVHIQLNGKAGTRTPKREDGLSWTAEDTVLARVLARQQCTYLLNPETSETRLQQDGELAVAEPWICIFADRDFTLLFLHPSSGDRLGHENIIYNVASF